MQARLNPFHCFCWDAATQLCSATEPSPQSVPDPELVSCERPGGLDLSCDGELQMRLRTGLVCYRVVACATGCLFPLEHFTNGGKADSSCFDGVAVQRHVHFLRQASATLRTSVCCTNGNFRVSSSKGHVFRLSDLLRAHVVRLR